LISTSSKLLEGFHSHFTRVWPVTGPADHLLFVLISISAIADHDKVSGLKQQGFMILPFCRLEVRERPQEVKMHGCVSLGGSRGKSMSLSFHVLEASKGCPHCLVCSPLLHLQSQQCQISLAILPSSHLCLTSERKRSHSDHSDNLHTSRSPT
jgi:hypothetical protein